MDNFYVDADWQRCMVHGYRNVSKRVSRGKSKDVAAMLKAIHAQEYCESVETTKTTEEEVATDIKVA